MRNTIYMAAAGAAFCLSTSAALASTTALQDSANPCVTGAQGCVLPTGQTQTVVDTAPPPPAAYIAEVADEPLFTGFRVEGLVGYDKLKSGDSDDDGVDTGEDEGDESIDGIVFGVGAGYDFDMGGVVAGIEAEYTESTGKQEIDESVDIPFSTRVEIGRDIYVGGRLGFKVAPTTLLYGKAGYTNTSIEAAFEGSGGDDDNFELDTNVDGWRLGAGIEQLFGPNMYGKIEYRYSNYSNLDYSDDFDLDELDPEDFQTNIDLDRHQVVLGLGLRF